METTQGHTRTSNQSCSYPNKFYTNNSEYENSQWTTTAYFKSDSSKYREGKLRGIKSLDQTQIVYKALLNRLVKQTDHLIGEYQTGFRKGRLCAEQIIWNLKMTLQCRQNTMVTSSSRKYSRKVDQIQITKYLN